MARLIDLYRGLLDLDSLVNLQSSLVSSRRLKVFLSTHKFISLIHLLLLAQGVFSSTHLSCKITEPSRQLVDVQRLVRLGKPRDRAQILSFQDTNPAI